MRFGGSQPKLSSGSVRRTGTMPVVASRALGSPTLPKNLLLDESIVLAGGVQYLISSQHRSNRNRKKSQWTISRRLEVLCFFRAHRRGWLHSDRGWSLHLDRGAPETLGKTRNGTSTKVAKFVEHAAPCWHGYPADLTRSADIPSTEVMKTWVAAGLIRKHEMSKVLRGIPCSL